MSSSTSTWTDSDPGTTTKYYRIGAVKPLPCLPSGGGIKADEYPYSHSMSNIDDNRLQTTSSENFNSLSDDLVIYPNPFNESAIVRFENFSGSVYTVAITDLSGKICRIVNDVRTTDFVLEKEDLIPGFYIIELRGEKILRGKIIIE